MARCLVIGGNGFLGSYLVDALSGAGHEVRVFDRFSAGVASYRAAGIDRFVGDFLNHADVRQALRGQEYVFHFLSTTTPASAEDDPTLDVRTNVASSIDLFQFAVEAGVSRLFFASTGGAMYGDRDVERLTEDMLPAPVSPYAIGKQAIEGYLRYFAVKSGLASTTFRISNPYGPRQPLTRKQGVIPIFLQRIALGQPIELLGDGSSVRDYIYAEDVARMIVATIDRPNRYPVYNIGSGHGTSVSELVELAKELTGRSVITRELPAPSTFVARAVVDTSRYVAEFGRPELVPLRAGMQLTWEQTLEQLA